MEIQMMLQYYFIPSLLFLSSLNKDHEHTISDIGLLYDFSLCL